MDRNTVLAVSVVALVAGTLACSSSSKAPLAPTLPSSTTTLPADGSTLKATAPTPQSPVNDQRVAGATPITLTASASTSTFGSSVPLQYHFQVFNAASALVQEGVVNTPSFTVTANLAFDTRHTWRARAESQGSAGPWSTPASFLSPNGGFIRGAQVFDPLTNSQSVGNVSGGTFLPGRGWQAQTLTDAINYDIPTTSAATFEFDISGVQSDEPGPYDIGMKFYCMGDSTLWDFIGFRNQPYKASLDRKSGKIFKGESGVVEHIFRTVDDDNRTKTGQRSWHEDQLYHIKETWGNGHVVATIDDEIIADESYGRPYAPPNHRISLGCTPRSETLKGAIWSNVKVTPN
jgi:hypothetical protein